MTQPNQLGPEHFFDSNETALRAAVRETLASLSADPQPLRLEMSKLDGLLLMQSLQLVLKHPEFKRTHQAQVVRNVVDAMQGELATSPAIAEVLRRGWTD